MKSSIEQSTSHQSTLRPMVLPSPPKTVLVRYGAIPEVARFGIAAAGPLNYGDRVVAQTHRGLEVGTLLQAVPEQFPRIGPVNGSGDDEPVVLRKATAADESEFVRLQGECEGQFSVWTERIRAWELDLELIDLERTLDGRKQILYVLNERGPDCTKLALQAAAAGLGIIEVQPVDSSGLVQTPPSGGGCGSGGCGCER